MNKPRHGSTPAKLYNSWRAMKNRCQLKSYINSNRYIERGITFDPAWDKFEGFREWALSNGWSEGLTLDRVNNNGNYCPENCRFVTQVVNCNNREVTTMVEYHGETKSFSLILREKGLKDHYHTIWRRIGRGWQPSKAIDTPIRAGAYSNRWA